MDWQPIETAPKDGTPFLFVCCNEVRLGFYDGYRVVTVPGRYTLPNPPTHWMPLPDPPVAERKADRE